jgi:hypothetical protein
MAKLESQIPNYLITESVSSAGLPYKAGLPPMYKLLQSVLKFSVYPDLKSYSTASKNIYFESFSLIKVH